MSETAAKRSVGLGAIAVALALTLGLAGASAAALLLGAAGVAAVAAGARGALTRAVAVPADPPVERRSIGAHAGVAADLLLGAAWEAGTLVRRVPDLERAGRDVEAAIARWRARGWLEHPALAHPPPPPLEKPRIDWCRIPAAGQAEHLCFASEYEPADPEAAARFQASRANRTAHVLLWRHRDVTPRPTLVVVHGFGMGRFRTDLRWLRVRGLDLIGLHRELRLDIAYVILPFHGPRAEGAWSGSGFFDRHPLAAPAALGQAVWDVRRLAGWLRAQGVPALGVQGLSLGGCVAALYASLDPALACAIPTVPAVQLADCLWRQMPPARRTEWAAAGLDLGRLREVWSWNDPLRQRVRAPHAARLVVAGATDQITPPTGALALWSHWEQPAAHWFPGGHLAWRGRDVLQRRLRDHLRATLLAEQPPAVPPLSRFRPGRTALETGRGFPGTPDPRR